MINIEINWWGWWVEQLMLKAENPITETTSGLRDGK